MTNQSPSSADPNKDKAVSDARAKEQKAHTDEALDEAIEESFPASDPVSMVVDGPRVPRPDPDFRPSDQHPETGRVAHPDRTKDSRPQQDNEPLASPEKASPEKASPEREGEGETRQR